MPKRPTIRLDWDTGEARFVMGSDLENSDWLTRADMLKDLMEQTRAAYEATLEEQLPPGHEELCQRVRNLRRRRNAEALVGHRISAAKALSNGDVAIRLGFGEVVVFASTNEPVDIKHAPSIEEAEAFAADGVRGSDYYTAEASNEDLELCAERMRCSVDELI